MSLEAKYYQETLPTLTLSLDLVAFRGESLMNTCSIWQNNRTANGYGERMTVFAPSREQKFFDFLVLQQHP